MRRTVNRVAEAWDWFALGVTLLGIPLGGAPRATGRGLGPDLEDYAPPVTVRVAPGDPPTPAAPLARPPPACPPSVRTFPGTPERRRDDPPDRMEHPDA